MRRNIRLAIKIRYILKALFYCYPNTFIWFVVAFVTIPNFSFKIDKFFYLIIANLGNKALMKKSKIKRIEKIKFQWPNCNT